jgi:hypothetical protein
MSIQHVVAALCLLVSPWAALAGSPAGVTPAAVVALAASPTVTGTAASASAQRADRSQREEEVEEVLPEAEGYRLLLAGAAAVGFVVLRRRD